MQLLEETSEQSVNKNVSSMEVDGVEIGDMKELDELDEALNCITVKPLDGDFSNGQVEQNSICGPGAESGHGMQVE